MERFFASVRDGEAFLGACDRHHLLDVLRAKAGDKLEIVSAGKLYEAKIARVSPLRVILLRELPAQPELPARLILAFSLLKGGHDEFVVQKGTELGVAAFAPFLSARTIIRLGPDEAAKKSARLEKIAIAAAEQSKRLLAPPVAPIRTFEEILRLPADHRLLAYEALSQGTFDLPSRLSEARAGESVLAAVGPEGGFEKEEAQRALEAGFALVSLGKRILRAETASLYLAAAFVFREEMA
jgi:16S rRNA (uracil1498-N3)-methyltransferase